MEDMPKVEMDKTMTFNRRNGSEVKIKCLEGNSSYRVFYQGSFYKRVTKPSFRD